MLETVSESLPVTLGVITQNHCPDALRDLPAGRVQRGQLFIEGSVARYFYEQWHREGTIERPEHRLRAILAARMRADGWQVSIEQASARARIDILAERDGEQRLIEVKVNVGQNDMAHALGQLLFYRRDRPEATLWVGCPERPRDDIASVLQGYDVGVLLISTEE